MAQAVKQIATILAVNFFTAGASAEVCAPRAELLAPFERLHQERPIAGGVTRGGTLIEILAKPGGRTWTLVLVRRDALACALEAGSNWREFHGKAART